MYRNIIIIILIYFGSNGICQENLVFSQAKNLANTKKFDSAIVKLNELINLNPNEYNYYKLRARCYYKLNKYTESISDCNNIMKFITTDPEVYNLRGLIFFKQNLFEKAAEDFSSAVALNNTTRDYFYNLGLCYRKMTQFEKAISNFKKCVIIKPNDKDSYYKLVECYNILGDYKNGLIILDSIKNFERDFDPLFVLEQESSLLFKKKEFNLALKKVNELEKIYGKLSDEFLFIKGLSYYYLNDYNHAIPILNSLIEHNKDFYSASILARANCYFHKQNYENAIKDYEAINLNIKNKAEISSKLGYSYYKIGNFIKADFYFNELEKSNKNDPYYYFYMGIVNSNKKKYEIALNQLYLALKNGYKDSAEVYKYSAEIYSKQANYKNAIQCIDSALKITPNDAVLISVKGMNYALSSGLGNGLEYLNLAVKLNPECISCLKNRANVYVELKNYDLAINDFKNLMILDSTDEGYLYYIGLFSLYLKKLNEADYYFQKLLLKDSNSYYPYFGLALLKANQNNYVQAVEFSNKAIELAPNQGDIYINRGKYFLALNKKNEACLDFKIAKKLGVTDEESLEFIKKTCN
jgi:tetratricopeptide (TPR) repeat protein